MAAVVEWLNKSLEKIDHKLFKDVHKAEDVEVKPLGDGQVIIISEINRVILTLKTSNGKKKLVKAIYKAEAASGPGREMATTCEAFTTEIRMYGDVLKSMAKLMTEIGMEDYLWGDCYHCGDNKLLFQDLCEYGYRVVPTYKFLDLDHTLLVMKAVGKFHALSMVMKEQNTLKSEHFKMPYYARQIPFMDAMLKQTVQHLAKTIKETWGPDWSTVPERILKYLDEPGQIVHDVWKSTNGKWDVLNHGDFTMRNMLFHYKPDSEKPDGIKFVDFQMCHYSNFANDVTNILYSSVRPQLRGENMDLLLETYLNSLCSTAKQCGYKGPLPSMQDLKASLRSLGPVRVTVFLLTIPFFVMSGKEDVQKKTDEYFEKYESFDDIAKAGEAAHDGAEFQMTFEDSDVKELLQFEIRKCIEEKLF